jgi:signal transduction histidine kinase
MREAISAISQQLEFAGSYQKAGTKPAEWVHVRLDLAGAMSGVELGHVKVENDVGNLEVWADPMFEKVLFNLLDNAVRHGGKLTRIRVFTERRGDDLVIVVEDDGVGVSPDEKELIFGKGYGKNTGHGLFLCREILGITGMTIVEVGDLGKGSRFEIFVPAGKHRG